MITDKFLRLSEAQAVTTDAVSENTVDLSVARDIGEGRDLYAIFTVTEAATSDTSGSTVDFQVISSAAAALTSPTIIGASGPIVKTDLTVGKQIAVRINPKLASNGQRYLGANFDVSATLTAGKFTTDIVLDVQDGKKFYASGFSVV